MRYLRQQNINKRAPYDQRLYVDMTDSIVMTTTNNLLVPKGTTAQRPVSPLDGMLRYNTSLGVGGELEIYQSGTWRSLRFKEPTEITQQELGIGNFVELLFGPINRPFATTVDSTLTSWDITQKAKQILVFVENVFQISGTNYELIQNPAEVTNTIFSFNNVTKSIISANTGIVDFLSKKFYSGMEITISGSASNDGTYTIDTVSSSTITVLESITAESVGSTVTISGGYTSGYYVAFDTPVPLGKPVTILQGFDQ
jgi:hypothetical protein